MKRIEGLGKDRQTIEATALAEAVRLADEITEIDTQAEPSAPATCPPDNNFESILDSLEDERIVPS